MRSTALFDVEGPAKKKRPDAFWPGLCWGIVLGLCVGGVVTSWAFLSVIP